MKFGHFLMVAGATIFLLSACGNVDRELAKITGKASKTCVDGVTYLQFTSGATIQLDINGKPVACE